MSHRLGVAAGLLAEAGKIAHTKKSLGLKMGSEDRADIETLVRLAYAHIDLDRREAEEEKSNGA